MVDRVSEAQQPLADRFRSQADFCRTAGSPLTADLLDGAAGELDSHPDGATAELLRPLEDDPPGSAPALRFAGALHRLVLERRAPALAVHYPSVGGTPGAVWPAARTAVEEHLELLRELVRRPVQTNEVGRSSALLGGLLHVAAEHGPRVRLLELGASAGLNLVVDRYRHEVAPGVVLGHATSACVLDDPWQGSLPPYDSPLEVVERLGCDPAPLDPGSTEDRLTLTSYVWADQRNRLERLRGALEVAAAHPARVRRSGAGDFLEQELEPRPGRTTVVWHSIVRQYLSPEERQRVRDLLHSAGARATAQAPLAHLHLEPARGHRSPPRFQVVLTTWPGARRRVLAECEAHGPPVVWR
jgi:hypothetical protein